MFDHLHDRLKHATAADHARLDAAVTGCGYFASRARYIAYLQRFCAFQSAAERLLTRHHAQLVLDDWPQRCRAALAQDDLQALGSNPATECTRHASALLVSAQPEHLLGTAYVLEGATLGGAVVLKALAPLGITAEHGGRFLASYGPARGAMWRRFLDTLAAWEARGIAEEETVRAARAAFRVAAAYLAPASD